MGEVGFYHLGPTALDRALPRLLERALADGHRVVVFAGSAERVTYLDGLLWTYNEASFLPHGTARDGNAARQPICLTDRDENPNRATMLVLLDGVRSEHLGDFGRGCASAMERREIGGSQPHLLATDGSRLGKARRLIQVTGAGSR